MNTFRPLRLWQRLAFALVTLVVGAGALELVAGAMKYPDPEAMAARERVIAMQAERAQQIRALAHGEMRYAGAVTVAVR